MNLKEDIDWTSTNIPVFESFSPPTATDATTAATTDSQHIQHQQGERKVKYILNQCADVTDLMILKHKEHEHIQREDQLETELYRSLKDLQESQDRVQQMNDRYALVTSMIPVGIFHLNLQGEVIYANEKWQQMTGLLIQHQQEQQLNQHWIDNIHSEDREKVRQAWEGYLLGIASNVTTTLPLTSFRFEFRSLISFPSCSCSCSSSTTTTTTTEHDHINDRL